MKTVRTFRYISVILLSSLAPLLAAQTANDTVSRPAENVRGIQYSSAQTVAEALRNKDIPLFAGVSVSADLAGAVMAVATSYGQFEAAGRVNLKGRFFPILELGWGMSDHTDEMTAIHYKTNAPYFRIGCDYNFAKDRRSGNRILGGLRYGFTTFDFDVDAPPVIDPYWGTSTPFHAHSQSAALRWLEIAFGLEAKVWRFLHLGWSVRYRLRMHEKKPPIGSAWYVPGYGRNDTHALGGTFNVIFDI